jgi:hypothetical protein
MFRFSVIFYFMLAFHNIPLTNLIYSAFVHVKIAAAYVNIGM